MSTDKGKQPIESNKESEEPPFPIPFPSFYLAPSPASQILIDNIWSTYLSGQCNFLMRKHLSDLANHLKYLEAKIQMLEQQCAPSSISPIEYRTQILEKVDILLPDDLAARIRDETLSCQIIERLINHASYLSWATGFLKMFLPAEEFDISYIEQGLVHRFILDRDNLAIHRQLPAIVKYALSCLGITKRNILITISSTLGERDEFRFYQPYQLWTIMNYEDGDLFYQKYSTPINDYEHLPYRQWNREWIESSDAATINYSLERLQFYNIQADQNQRFINLKRHLEFARTFKGLWSDGRRVICIDEDLVDDTFVYYDPFRSGHTILDEILEKFTDVSSLDITERTKRQLIPLFQREIESGAWTPSPLSPEHYNINE